MTEPKDKITRDRVSVCSISYQSTILINTNLRRQEYKEEHIQHVEFTVFKLIDIYICTCFSINTMLTKPNHLSLEANMDVPHKEPIGKGKRKRSLTVECTMHQRLLFVLVEDKCIET
jgi:hypothetical protein